jgi:hypothetical protein
VRSAAIPDDGSVMDDDEDVVRDLYERLKTERAGTVLALWPDGGVTVEGFGFHRQRERDGVMVDPLLTVPAKSPITFRELLERLRRARERQQGW